MKFTMRELVFVIVLMGIPVGTWWFVFKPLNVQNTELCQQIDAKRSKLEMLYRTVGTVEDRQREIDALEGAIAKLEAKLPSKKEIDKVLRETWDLAENNSLTTKSIRPLRVSNGTSLTGGVGPHIEQPISVKLEGSFQGFYGFLQALETRPRIMRIKKLTLKKPRNNDLSPGYIQAEFVMSIFFEEGNL